MASLFARFGLPFCVPVCSGVAVAVGGGVLLIGSPVKAAVPVDAVSLTGVPFEQVKARFRRAGYSWTQQHDNRYTIWVAEKAGNPTYTCQFARIGDFAFVRERGDYLCEHVSIELPRASSPTSARAVAPANGKPYQTLITTEGGSSPTFTVRFVQRRTSDGACVVETVTLAKNTPLLTCRMVGKGVQVTAVRGWESGPIKNVYEVELRGPHFARNHSGGGDPLYPVDPLRYGQSSQDGVLLWQQGDQRKNITYSPTYAGLRAAAVNLLSGVRMQDWGYVRSMFPDKDAEALVATCKKYQSQLVKATLAPVKPAPYGAPNFTYYVAFNAPKGYVFGVTVDSHNKIVVILPKEHEDSSD